MEFDFYVEATVPATVALRQHGGAPELTLDGKILNAVQACTSLPEGLKTLYRETHEVILMPGMHRLKMNNETNDLPYLPLAFIVGQFSISSDKIIRVLGAEPSTIPEFFADELSEYAGTVIFESIMNLTGCENIAAEYENMAFELLLDGKPQGVRLWQPFAWTVPPEFRHEGTSVAFRVATSVGPLFATLPAHMLEKYPDWFINYWPKHNKLKFS